MDTKDNEYPSMKQTKKHAEQKTHKKQRTSAFSPNL